MLPLFVYIFIVSDSCPNSLHILLNSAEGIVQIELNSVYGIPSVYVSRDINAKLNYDIFSPPSS